MACVFLPLVGEVFVSVLELVPLQSQTCVFWDRDDGVLYLPRIETKPSVGWLGVIAFIIPFISRTSKFRTKQYPPKRKTTRPEELGSKELRGHPPAPPAQLSQLTPPPFPTSTPKPSAVAQPNTWKGGWGTFKKHCHDHGNSLFHLIVLYLLVDCNWVRSLDFKFLGIQGFGFPLNPQKVLKQRKVK